MPRSFCRLAFLLAFCVLGFSRNGLAQAPLNGLFREVWTNITGGTVATLTNNAAYPNSPTSSNYISTIGFEAPVNFTDNYGQRIRGYIYPPQTGEYVFTMASDDYGTLYLSPDGEPTNLAAIAYVAGSTGSREWTKYATQRSAPIRLEAGRTYYIEALMKEGGGNDNLAVKWMLPDGTEEIPLPITRLRPWNTPFIAPSITQQPAAVTVTEGGEAVFRVRVSNVNTMYFQWQKGGVNIPGANGPNYTNSPAQLADNNAQYRCFLSNSVSTTFSSSVGLTVQADTTRPRVVNAFNIGSRTVRLEFDEAVEAASATTINNYVVSGMAVSGVAFGGDTRTILLTLSASMTTLQNYTVTINNVKDQAVAQNVILAGSQISFTASDFAPASVGQVSGSVSYVTGGIDVTETGGDIAGSSDGFRYDYQTRSGNFDVKVRVAEFFGADLFSKAGLMARATLDANSAFAGAFATPSLAGAFALSRLSTAAGVTKAGYAPVNYPETWLRLSRAGNVFTSYASVDGSTWVNLGQVTIAMPAAVYLGTAVASHDATVPVTARFRDWSDASGGAIVLALPVKGEPLAASSRRTGIIISEIMYHPADRADTNNLEFIELFNTDPMLEDLSGYRLTGAVDFTFPAGTILRAGAFLVVAKDANTLKAEYAITNVIGNYVGALNNDSDIIRLKSKAGAMILEAHYSDKIGWPLGADGAGHSLVLARPSYGEGAREAWAASAVKGGSPGRAEPIRSDVYEPLFINEILAHTDLPQVDYIEIYNHSNGLVNLGGCFLTDDRNTNKYRFPDNTTIQPGGFLAVDENALGFRLEAEGETIYLVASNNVRVIDAVRFQGQENGVAFGRFPDGSAGLRALQSVTKGSANAPAAIGNIVLNEIMYHPISELDEDEYVELFNRGGAAVDLSGWRFTDGIDFTFPPNTVIAANGYLVVAKDAAHLRTNYAQLNSGNLIGDYDGTLSNSGERLALSKPDEVAVMDDSGVMHTNIIYIVAVEVQYGQGGRWGKWSDGGGSSLELVNARADAMQPSSWADSDEEAKSAWTTVEFTGVLDNGNGNYPPEQFQMHLQGGGECLVDDVEVLRFNGPNLIGNPGFETDPTNWVAQGAFKNSGVVAGVGIGGSRALRVTSPVRGDTGGNRIYYNLGVGAMVANDTATLRAKARWLKGSPEFLMRLRGNWLEAFGRMSLPTNLGTPGLANSRARSNIGPAIYEVTHAPVLPAANQAVVVTARATDPDGFNAPQLRWRLDASATFNSVTMNDSGSGGDAIAADGIWSATIPAQAATTLVAFYVTATDRAGVPVAGSFPQDAPNSTCVVRWGETQAPGTLATYRIWMTLDTAGAWKTRHVLDNSPLDVTFVYGNCRAIYNVGALYSGSPFHAGYNGPTNSICDYVLNFRDDETFLGATDFVLNSVGNLNNDDTGQREQAAFWILKQLGVPYNHRRHINMVVNGLARGRVYEDAQQPNAYLVEGWFNDDTDGELLKIEDWFEFNDAATGFGNVDATLGSFTTTGGVLKQARYRWSWRPRAVKRSANDFVNFFELVRAVNDTTSAYTTRVENVADIEEWMRVFCGEHIVGNWDSYGYRRGKNMFTYRPRNGKWTMLPWDIDFVLGLGDPTTGDIFSQNDARIGTMYSNPTFRRAYLRAFQDAVNGPLQAAKIGQLLDARYESMIANGVNVVAPTAVKTWVADRVAYLQSTYLTPVAAPFAITSNGGANFSTNKNFITLTGTAPVGIKTIEVNGAPYPVTWTSVTAWSMTIPLLAANNVLTLRGFDAHGELIPNLSTSITITYTGALTSPKDFVVFNEIMYNSLATNASFVEFANISTTTAFDLSGFRLDGADFTFPDGSVIVPGGFLVVAKNAAFFSAAYGSGIPLAGEFQGSLDNGGERLKLIKPGTTPDLDEVIDVVRYDDDPPWPIAADGTGPSLQLIDATKDNTRAGNWTASTSPTKFTPGAANNVRVTIPAFPTLWINEVLPNNTNSITDGAGDRDPWIELFNSGTSAIDLSAFYLTDDYAALTKWQFPAGLSLNPGQYLIVWADGEPQESAPGAPHTSFRLAPATGSLALTRIQNNAPAVVDYVNYTLLSPNRSYGSYPDGQSFDRQVFHFVTPREANDNTTLVVPIRINEWMASNTRMLADPADLQFEDWFELYNYGSEPVDLTGYYLTDALTNKTLFKIPPGYIVPARGYLLVWADGEKGQNVSTNIDLHADFKLATSGEEIGLFGADGTQIDAITFPAQQDDISEGRYPDGGGTPYFSMTQPTPRAENVLPSGNKPPTLDGVNSATIPEMVEKRIQATASDLDAGQTLTFSLIGGPRGASIDAATGLFRWTPTEADGPGNFTMTIRVTDNGTPALSRSQPFTLNVTEVNSDPNILDLPDITIDELLPLSFTTEVNDSDFPAQPLIFSLDEAPPGLTLNPVSGFLEWIPTEAQGPGIYPVTIRVTDTASAPRFTTNQFLITVRDVNTFPLVNDIPDQVVFEGESLSLDVVASDSDLPTQTLTYSIRNLAGAQISASGHVSWTPSAGQIPSTNNPIVAVTDSAGATTEKPFKVIAAPPNHAPTFQSIATLSFLEEANSTFDLIAQDEDPGQTVSFSLLTPISGLSLSSAGKLSWQPTELQGPSTNPISFRITDNGLPNRNATGSVTIVVIETNQPPSLPAIAAKTITLGETLTLNLNATDADRPINKLTYSFVSGPPEVSVNSTNGQLTWTPTARYENVTTNITVRVTDDGSPSLSASQTFSVAVKPPTFWKFASFTGTVASSTLYIYLDAPGSVIIDDMRLVAGTNAATGPNLLPNGDFEATLTPPWTISTNLSGSYRTNIAKSGAFGLYVAASSAGTTRASSIFQDISPALTANNTYTLSYWYVPNTISNNVHLITRLSSSALTLSTSIYQTPPPPTILIDATILSTGELQLVWPSRAGVKYRVYYNPVIDADPSTWPSLADITATGATTSLKVPFNLSTTRYFLIQALP